MLLQNDFTNTFFEINLVLGEDVLLEARGVDVPPDPVSPRQASSFEEG